MVVVSEHLLIDASCAVEGYVEDMRGDLTVDGRHIATLCRRFGVGAIRDTGSGVAAKSRFNHVENSVGIIGGTISITDSAPFTRSEVVITSVSQLNEVISLCAAIGERWICVRSKNPDFFHAVRATAEPIGISICGRGSAVVGALKAGDIQIVDGVAALLPVQTSPIEALVSAATVTSSAWSELTNEILAQGVSVCTGLVSLRRSVFLKEAIQAPYLEELSTIIPHSQYLHRMRQGAGYLAGKRALETHSGMREPTGGERRVLDEGWERITTWVASAVQAGVTLLPASKAPQLAVLPGYGLLEELALLAHLGVPPVDTIRLATTVAADTLGVSPVPGALVTENEGVRLDDDGEASPSFNALEAMTRDSLLSLRCDEIF